MTVKKQEDAITKIVEARLDKLTELWQAAGKRHEAARRIRQEAEDARRLADRLKHIAECWAGHFNICVGPGTADALDVSVETSALIAILQERLEEHEQCLNRLLEDFRRRQESGWEDDV